MKMYKLGITVFAAMTITAALISPSQAGSNGSGGIPEVLRQLELVTGNLEVVTSKLESIESRLTFQRAQITELQEQTIPCTPERYRANLCGDGNLPFDLVVSICAGMGGSAGIDGKYAIDSKMSIQGGVGWKEVLDVDLTAEAGMPVVLKAPFLPPVILPNEIAISGGASIGLDVNGCIEGIKIPIGGNIDRARIDALLAMLEDGSSEIQESLLSAMESTYNFTAITAALEAQRSIASNRFESADPLSVFTDAQVRELLANLPVGSRLSELVGNPADMVPDFDPTNLNLCDSFQGSLVISEKTARLCTFVGTSLPQFNTVADAFERIATLESLMLDLPDTIEYLVREALPDIDPILNPLPPTSKFCLRFPRLCRQ